MLGLINEMSELVYVVDTQTYEILFINKIGRRMFHLEEKEHQKCYEVLQGKDKPCEFCTTPFLKENEFYTWEYRNPVSTRHYVLKDRLIDWNGKLSRVEIAFDITEKEEQKQELQNLLDAQIYLLECIKILHTTENFSTAFQEVLRTIGEFLMADRSYYFEIRDQKMYNTFEWCTAKVEPQMAYLQNLDVHLIDRWQASFINNQCIVIDDIRKIKDLAPEEYQSLVIQNIHCLVASPVLQDGNLIGYMGVDNPPLEKMKNIGPLLNTLSIFIGASIQREKQKERLELLSYIDLLTDVPNRNAYHRDVETIAKQKESPLGVIYLDINGMKAVNDKYGHPSGDKMLLNIAQTLKEQFLKQNIYRVGGDEFVVLCCNYSREHFSEAILKLKQRMSGYKEYSVAIGTNWSPSCSDVEKLIFEADEQMYRNKREFYRGKAVSTRYRYQNDDVLGFTTPGVLQRMLKAGQFLVYFQPKMSVAYRTIIGAEALVRFQTTTKKIVPPDRFIPVLEEAKIVSYVDFYVYEFVLKKMKQWLQEGRKLIPISVNFSRNSLAEFDFNDHLIEVWKKYQIEKKYIEIEVTESVDAEDNNKFLRIIEQTRQLGFSISIDDFGVKYANLSLFTTANFDVLKIDKSLILDLSDNIRAQTVIQSITNICQKMNVQLIVEGVETEEQLKILQLLNCDGAQGYLFSKPLPLSQFEQTYLT